MSVRLVGEKNVVAAALRRLMVGRLFNLAGGSRALMYTMWLMCAWCLLFVARWPDTHAPRLFCQSLRRGSKARQRQELQHSSSLQLIDSGMTNAFYYRVIKPLQQQVVNFRARRGEASNRISDFALAASPRA